MNRKSVELKALMAMLVNDVNYQHRLRKQFVKRRVHPTTEALVWAYAVGRPVEKVQMTASVAMSEQLAGRGEPMQRHRQNDALSPSSST